MTAVAVPLGHGDDCAGVIEFFARGVTRARPRDRGDVRHRRRPARAVPRPPPRGAGREPCAARASRPQRGFLDAAGALIVALDARGPRAARQRPACSVVGHRRGRADRPRLVLARRRRAAGARPRARPFERLAPARPTASASGSPPPRASAGAIAWHGTVLDDAGGVLTLGHADGRRAARGDRRGRRPPCGRRRRVVSIRDGTADPCAAGAAGARRLRRRGASAQRRAARAARSTVPTCDPDSDGPCRRGRRRLGREPACRRRLPDDVRLHAAVRRPGRRPRSRARSTATGGRRALRRAPTAARSRAGSSVGRCSRRQLSYRVTVRHGPKVEKHERRDARRGARALERRARARGGRRRRATVDLRVATLRAGPAGRGPAELAAPGRVRAGRRRPRRRLGRGLDRAAAAAGRRAREAGESPYDGAAPYARGDGRVQSTSVEP